jgi:histidyl-tRNA synthetase
MKLIKSITGIPEWLPEIREIELSWIKQISSVYGSFGYAPIETGAFERLETLQTKGEIDKELYFVSKKHSEDLEKYGLHYDLTVPFSRYVAQNYNSLSFPFKRYQIQKVWRGERPQRGRYREFYQCDIDVIDNEKLSLFYDTEVLYVGALAMRKLNLPPYTIGISNRKIYEGYLEALDIPDTTAVLRIIDKMDKIGREGVFTMLKDEMGLSENVIQEALKPAEIKTKDLSFVELFKRLNVKSEKVETGLKELQLTFSELLNLGCTEFEADLSFVRGFDYYTGIICEGKFIDDPKYGSICSGGRYDNLTGKFINKRLPGVGFSIGLTRIFAKLVDEGYLKPLNNNNVDAIIFRTRDDDTKEVFELATILTKKGVKVEIYNSPIGISKQFKYASKKNIPWVWLESKEQKGEFEVKNMITGEQSLMNPELWNPELNNDN